MFKPHRLRQYFSPGHLPSPSPSLLPPLTPLPLSSFSPSLHFISRNERTAHDEPLAHSATLNSDTYSAQTNVFHSLFHIQDVASTTPSLSTTRPILSQTPISDRFSCSAFVPTKPLFTTEAGQRPASSNSGNCQITDIPISTFDSLAVSPSRLRTTSVSLGFLHTEHSLEIITSEIKEKRGAEGEEEGEEEGEQGDSEPSANNQGFDIMTSETSNQQISGATLQFKSRDVSRPTIDIHSPCDETIQQAQSTLHRPTTLHSVKHSLRKIGRFVKEPWAKFKKKKEERVSNEDHSRVSQPFEISNADNQHRNTRPLANHIPNIPPERPAQFPFQTRTDRQPHHVHWTHDSSRPRINTIINLEEARQRERFHRRALKRLKTIGRFRRRPNLIPVMTEGRITEPVEVARIRRAYNQSRPGMGGRRQGQDEWTKETLLERVNRQRRAQVQEWRVTTFPSSYSQVHGSSLNSTRATIVVSIPLQDKATESRPSLRKTLSTQSPGDKSMKKGRDFTLAPKSRFALHWSEYYERKKLASLRESAEEKRHYRKPRSKKRSPCQRRAPSSSPLSRSNSLTSIFSVQGGRDQLDKISGLEALAESITRNIQSYVPPRPLVSAPSSVHSSLHLPSTATSTNRLSVISTASCNSAVSCISSMANSIYSVLSEDWNRPFFFAPSKSHRCPPGLQNHVRALPPYNQLIASITTTSILEANPDPQMTAADGRVRSRSLRNRDGSTLQSTLGHELHSTDIRIAWQQVGEGFVEDDEDPVLAISRPCLTALPSIRDRFGFVEYGDESDDNEEVVQGQLHGVGSMGSRCTGTDDEWVLVNSSRPILDANGTSVMIAAGIDPSEEHSDSMAFYYIHHPVEDRMSIHHEPLEAAIATETATYNQNHCPELDTAAVDSTFEQSFRSILFKTSRPIVKCLRQIRKSRVVKKWISRPLRSIFSSGRDETPRFTATEIRRTGLGMDQARSDTRSSMCSDGWLHRLPGGPAAAGKFDRDWLDASAEVL